MYLLLHEEPAQAAAIAARLERGGESARVVTSVAELRSAAAAAAPKALLVSLATQESWGISLERSAPAVADAPVLFVGGREADVYQLFGRRWYRGLTWRHLEGGSPDALAEALVGTVAAPTRIPGRRWWFAAGWAVLLAVLVVVLAAPGTFPHGSARHVPGALVTVTFLWANLPVAAAATRQGLKVPMRQQVMNAVWGLLLIAWTGLAVAGALGR
jgi:hypothetical protein